MSFKRGSYAYGWRARARFYPKTFGANRFRNYGGKELFRGVGSRPWWSRDRTERRPRPPTGFTHWPGYSRRTSRHQPYCNCYKQRYRRYY